MSYQFSRLEARSTGGVRFSREPREPHLLPCLTLFNAPFTLSKFKKAAFDLYYKSSYLTLLWNLQSVNNVGIIALKT